MTAALSDADAQLIVGVLVFFSTVFGLFLAARKANNVNRAEHAGNTSRLESGLDKLDELLENQNTIRHEIQFIRSDVTDIHGAINELRSSDSEHHTRITRLERHPDDAA